VLVRLSDSLPSTTESVNEALGQSITRGAVSPPGVAATETALEQLRLRGDVERSSDGWLLTAKGLQRFYTLEDRFENSGQRGDYGF
jgi:hypothetical protein